MKTTRQVEFEPGPPIQPTQSLLQWLNQEASPSRRRVQLPVVIRFEDAYRLAIRSAAVGVSEGESSPGAISLRLDDSTMGMSLLSTLNYRLPKTVDSCVVWLEGLWGPAIQTSEPETSAPWPFTVTGVREFVDANAKSGEEVRAQIERRTP